MRITQEADYAIRICAALAKWEGMIGTPQLSENLCVPPRFTSKILRKLAQSGIVKSVRGVNGGFILAQKPKDVTLKSIIEAIDGEIAIRHCLLCDHNCSYQEDKSKCKLHQVFRELNEMISSRLEALTISDMVNESFSVEEIITKMKK